MASSPSKSSKATPDATPSASAPECAVCLCALANGGALYTGECAHVFHFACVPRLRVPCLRVLRRWGGSWALFVRRAPH
jgi:hypothetical protein